MATDKLVKQIETAETLGDKLVDEIKRRMNDYDRNFQPRIAGLGEALLAVEARISRLKMEFDKEMGEKD